MNVLVDVGGTHVKILATGKKEKREFASGSRLTAPKMVLRVRKLAQDWKYQVVSIGYPGPVVHNRPVAEPRNLGSGWRHARYARSCARRRPLNPPSTIKPSYNVPNFDFQMTSRTHKARSHSLIGASWINAR